MPKKFGGAATLNYPETILPNQVSTGTYNHSKYETAVMGYKGGNCGVAMPSILKITGGRRRKHSKKNRSKKTKKTVRWFW
jgi:hypothetical protein